MHIVITLVYIIMNKVMLDTLTHKGIISFNVCGVTVYLPTISYYIQILFCQSTRLEAQMLE